MIRPKEMRKMIKQRRRLVGVCAATAALAIAGGATTALADRDHPEDGAHHDAVVTASALRHFDGTVLSKKRQPKRFTIRTEAGQKRKFRVNAMTEFERISGFGSLHRGLEVQVEAKRTDRGLLARKVEKRGGGSGGANDTATDDHGSGGNGADDTGIDDHGSGGGGSDDGPNHT
jgi:hypothetical protein